MPRARAGTDLNNVQSVGQNLAWGILWGLSGSAAYSVAAFLVYLIGGHRAFDSRGVSLFQTVAFYFLAGGVVGVLLGLMRPTLKHTWGTVLAGVLCSVVIWMGVFAMLEGPAHIGRFESLATLILSVTLGPACALSARRQLG